ncbi:CLUMA_CG003544, isoform A [Clunio marinus]|uniref:CLUMA_CG003544, isoform A n=1 Tax=Clunio marinus TaxID=568069 RepID=A0A1J1HP57_9DIPT|nr:CLUMA_CG003544, isoform A [Clunio marinus]
MTISSQAKQKSNFNSSALCICEHEGTKKHRNQSPAFKIGRNHRTSTKVERINSRLNEEFSRDIRNDIVVHYCGSMMQFEESFSKKTF